MGNHKLASFLEQKIDEIQKKLDLAQSDYQQLKDEHQVLIDKILKARTKYQRLANLLTEYLDHLIEENPTLIQDDEDLHLDIDHIKEVDQIEKLSK
mmetsp:Transcript_42193/g.40427  ORF Transcript_42193/g.40427 Transcript_42193/m.40427 type:complete len:96 (+) Transcript_42193:72-359(+)